MYDEKELIRECLSGNRLAEKQLDERYSALFFGICLRYADCREEAEDLLVSGFTMIFEHLPEFRHEGSFEGWMKRIIVHNAIDCLRKRHNHTAERIDEESLETGISADSALQRLEAREALEAIRKLPATLRTIFNLYAVEGFTHKEIARKLNMNETTVRVYFQRARTMLQKLLSEK